ncbi:MAG: hypothetical protein H0X33_06810 [Taibaiella sp.]|nr:hypothetical protein [Taibaiella sp.]
MGCGNCGTTTGGKPSGCKSNGGCSTGGCNRMNVFDWLSTLPLQDTLKPFPVIEVSFSKGSRKDFYRNNTNHILEKGDYIALEGVGGFDIGQVSLTGELVKLQMKKYSVENNSQLKRVLHPATEEEIAQYHKQKERESEVLVRARAMARSYNLQMKLAEAEIQADGKKATFFYTADQRVDFRELIKAYASEFRVKVEMRQIGARQESGKVGGIGSCGRELCCSTWLTDFKSVNTTAARYQNLSINQTKLSGQCGRLKCCLNYELDTYMDALSVFPDNAEQIQTVQGTAYLQKRDIFKNLMWYSFPGSSKQYPLAITRVKEIIVQNKQGIKPDELQAVELELNTGKAVKVDVGFVNDVGQITLRSLEKGNRKKKPGGGNNKPQLNADGSTQTTERPQNRPARPQGARPDNRQRGAEPGSQPQRPQQPKREGSKPNQPKNEGAQQPNRRPPQPQKDNPGNNNQQARRNRGNNPNRNNDAKPPEPTAE